MPASTDITIAIGSILGAFGIAHVVRHVVIYNWPESKLGKVFAWGPEARIKVDLAAPEFYLLKRLVEAQEGTRLAQEGILELMPEDRRAAAEQRASGSQELTAPSKRLLGARR